MIKVTVGDHVGRRSYGCDLSFVVLRVYEENGQLVAVLKGLDTRLLATAPVADLVRLYDDGSTDMRHRRHRLRQVDEAEASYFERYGLILHLDGDREFLARSLNYYKTRGFEAVGFGIDEAEQAAKIPELLLKYQPELLVLTGHDGLIKNSDPTDLKSYHHSEDYARAVEAARKLRPDLDDLVIFAGGCQSYFEALIRSGANFASAPDRVLINDLDPSIVIAEINRVRVDQLVPLEDVVEATSTGAKGIGGVDTRGKRRRGLPAKEK
ncbi:MAG: sporulation peptidase YabG [Bacillota bacterium]